MTILALSVLNKSFIYKGLFCYSGALRPA